MQSLDAIGVATGTDKSSIDHDFLAFYEEEFQSFRNRIFLLLEIGVYHGQSMLTWASYFPEATIVGIDIDPAAAHRFPIPSSCQVKIGDGSRLETHDEIIANNGNPLLIIDDGSHLWHQQIETLRYLWPRIQPGGAFVMEDIHTSFPALACAYKGFSTESAYDYLLKLQRWVVGNRQMGDETPNDGFIATYWPTVRSMHWYRGTCVIHKK